MRDRKSVGPQDWSQDVVDKIALKKENNRYPKVDKAITDRWHRFLDASRDGDQHAIGEILKK